VIRFARYEEWGLIESWRNEHFLNMYRAGSRRPVLGQKGFRDAIWLVLERRGKAVAALSYTQMDKPAMRFVHDMYAAPGHSVAGLALGEYFERYCDHDGFEMRGSTDPENIAYLRFLLRRGYEITTVHFRRVPRQASERNDSGITASPSSEADAVFAHYGG